MRSCFLSHNSWHSSHFQVCTIKYTNARLEQVPFQTIWCQEAGTGAGQDQDLSDQLTPSFSSDDPVEVGVEGEKISAK